MTRRIPLLTLAAEPRTDQRDSAHEDSLAHLAYDHSRVCDPNSTPRLPFKVYLPHTTEDVVQVVLEAKQSGEPVVVRGRAHSSNHLVTPDRGVVMLTEFMNRILDVDEGAMTVTVQCGAPLRAVDAHLSELGLGLPVLADHDGVTAAGFASVGGISPASHVHGLFVDTVQAMEYVDWRGKVQRCSRTQHRDALLRLLGGTGRHGVITTLTIAVIAVDKSRTVYANRRHLTPSLDGFLSYSGQLIRDPGDAVLERGMWADLPLPGLPATVRLGQFSSYHPTRQRAVKSLWSVVAHGYQQALRPLVSRLPGELARYVDVGTAMFSPGFATMRDLERVCDGTRGAASATPARSFVVLGPADRYSQIVRQLYRAALDERSRSGAVGEISLHVRSVRSPYLSGGDPHGRYCAVSLWLGLNPRRTTDEVLRRLVADVDDVAVANGAYRSLDSLTSSEPTIRERVDPNTQYAGGGARL
jgi:hypothetical protein